MSAEYHRGAVVSVPVSAVSDRGNPLRGVFYVSVPDSGKSLRGDGDYGHGAVSVHAERAGEAGGISKIWSYLPGAYIGSWTFTEYRLVFVFGKNFNNLQAAPIFWLLASAAFLGIAKAAYRHYQVLGK